MKLGTSEGDVTASYMISYGGNWRAEGATIRMFTGAREDMIEPTRALAKFAPVDLFG